MIGEVGTERNYGIDLLRIVSMYLVVVLHLLGSADIEAYLPLCSLKYEVAWFLEMMAFCAVNCYALISGYVSVNRKYHISNLIIIWFQVLFYSVLITGMFKLICPETVDARRMVNSFFPVLTGQYWYFTAYFGLYLVMPALKCILEKMTQVELKRIVWIGFVVLSVLPTLINQDIFNTADGYSVLWLSYLFVLGAYIRKYNVFEKMQTSRLVLIWFGSIILPLGIKFLIEYISWNYFEILTISTAMTKYTSINVVVEAVVLLVFFSRIKVSGAWKKVITLIAPTSFGIYLIHSNELVLENLLFGKLENFAQLSVVAMAGTVLVVALAIFLLCTVIDLARLKIFEICRVKKLAEAINRKVLG